MKNLTTLLLTILLFTAAKCQEPDTECYSIGYVDSIQTLLDNSESQNIVLNDSISTLYEFIFSDSLILNAENQYVRIIGAGVTVEVRKQGQNVSFSTKPRNIIE